jgi:hypothetical protein
MTDLGDLFKTIGMDPKTGMLPAQPCRGCGRQLNADGHHPAELYAGTFTGLCYPCTDAVAFRVGEPSRLDGAERWSHRPYCPSHRREREIRVWYPDCDHPKCHHGQTTHSSYSNPWGWVQQCETCSKRYYQHPIRARAIQRTRSIREVSMRLFEQQVKRERCQRKVKRGENLPDEVIVMLRKPILERVNRMNVMAKRISEKRGA